MVSVDEVKYIAKLAKLKFKDEEVKDVAATDLVIVRQ